MRIRDAYLLALLVSPGAVHAQLATSDGNVFSPSSKLVFIAQPPGESIRKFYVEQVGASNTFGTTNGRITIGRPGDVNWTEFAIISEVKSLGQELGLRGLAFHPNFASNRKLYVLLTNTTWSTEIRELTASLANPDRADPGFRTVLSIPQTPQNPSNGCIAFGPDGFLYVGTGDGSSFSDQNGNALNISDLRGKLLRINVDADDFPNDPNKNYGIPAGNPYVGVAGEDEIWAIGIQNPRRFAFDSNALNGFDSLTIADASKSGRDEVNQIRKGVANINYGWRVIEGSQITGLTGYNGLPVATLPIWEAAKGISESDICGGEIYRGWELGPEYWNQYIFGDFLGNYVCNFKLTQNVQDGSATATDGAGPFGVAPLGRPYRTGAAGNKSESLFKDNSGELWKVTSGTTHKIIRVFPSGQLARKIEGTITFNDIQSSGLPMGIILNIDVIGSGSPTSDFALPLGLKPDKTYRVPVKNANSRAWIKAGTFLRRVLSFDATASNLTNINFSLINGDVDQNGEIGPSDFDSVVAAFGVSGVNSADIDKDGEVGPSDFDIVVANFGLGDDPL